MPPRFVWELIFVRAEESHQGMEKSLLPMCCPDEGGGGDDFSGPLAVGTL
jgi:hypothetical protein